MYDLYFTLMGRAFVGDSQELLEALDDNSVDLVITSPPFALQRQKEYGNKDQDEYVDWLVEFGHDIFRVLKDSGSFVLDLGGAYKKGRPVRSLYNFRVLIRMCYDCGFNLAEEFFSKYLRLCKDFSAKKHPARFPSKLPEFFIDFLTDENDLAVDIFAGSNTTGETAELRGRRWIVCDLDRDYLAASALRFFEEPINEKQKNI